MSKTIVGLKNDILLDNRCIYKKIVQQKISQKTYEAGNFLHFDIEDIDTADNLIEFSNDGLITVNYVGLVRLNANIWLGNDPSARPWLQFKNYTTGEVLADVIDDNTSGYTNLTINNYVFENKEAGTKYGLAIAINSNEITINKDSARTNSYINIEIL